MQTAELSASNWPREAKKVSSNMRSAHSDHPAHGQSMIRAFALHSYILFFANFSKKKNHITWWLASNFGSHIFMCSYEQVITLKAVIDHNSSRRHSEINILWRFKRFWTFKRTIQVADFLPFLKGDNFCDFLFVFRSINPFLKRGLL